MKFFDFFRELGDKIQDIIDKIRGKEKNKREDYSDHPVYKVTRWYGGVNMKSAIVDPNYQLSVSPDGKGWSEMPLDWAIGGRMMFPAMCVAAYQNNAGEWVGGKYEWLPRPPRPRSWGNIENNYNGWIPPSVGTKIWVWAYTFNGNRVSTSVELIYKGK